MAYGPKITPFDDPAAPVGPQKDREPKTPRGAERCRDWSLRKTANLMIGVTGALWALVAIVIKLLF